MILHLLLTSLAWLQEPAPLTNADLRLTATAVKPQVLVGEFTKVSLNWTALRQVLVLFGAELVSVDSGTGFVDHAEASLVQDTTAFSRTPLAVGDVRLTEYVIGIRDAVPPPGFTEIDRLNASVAFVFSQPGIYHVRVRYEEAESNVVQVEVVAPQGADTAVLDALRSNLATLTPAGGADETLIARGEELVQAYGAHVYLVPVMRGLYDGVDRAAFDRRSAFDTSQSAFAADELFWVADIGSRFFDDAWTRAALERVLLEYPNRAVAEEAAEALLVLDTEPPALSVAAAPPGLWPPNGKLVPVSVLVSITDSYDRQPVVRLESVTCDDNCSVDDVVGAAIGTDDREFQLRATRTGGGDGRTYTITYSATDVAQNRNEATTTVRVPHDRGRQ